MHILLLNFKNVKGNSFKRNDIKVSRQIFFFKIYYIHFFFFMYKSFENANLSQGRVQNLCPSLHNVTRNDYLWKYGSNLQLKGLMWVKLENILYLYCLMRKLPFPVFQVLSSGIEISISELNHILGFNPTLDAISIVQNVRIIITK